MEVSGAPYTYVACYSSYNFFVRLCTGSPCGTGIERWRQRKEKGVRQTWTNNSSILAMGAEVLCQTRVWATEEVRLSTNTADIGE